ncbi:MAG TPA: GIY-YIG nuclease family protein [bacterium]
MKWVVYILRCGRGELYTGVTSNLGRRLVEHQTGIGGWFTSTSQPIELAYHETYSTKADATRREVQLKGWTRRKKLALIAGDLKALKQT